MSNSIDKKQKRFKKVDFKHKDLKMGDDGEKICLKYLNTLYQNEVSKYKDFFHPFDFYKVDDDGNTDMIFELKTRRCDINQYPSLCFGKSKIDFALEKRKKNPNLRIMFLWLLKDKQFYCWEYGDEKTDEFYYGEIANYKRNQKPSQAIFIKTEYIEQLPIIDYHKILSA